MKISDSCETSAVSGFTLVEIIVTIVLIGILGAMSAQFLASALEGSTQPIDRVQAEAGRVSIMEKIISDYVIAVNGNSPAAALTTMATNVANGDYNTGGTSVTTAWIAFVDSGNDDVDTGKDIYIETVITPGPTDNLKVSVATGNAFIVTILSATRTSSGDPKVDF